MSDRAHEPWRHRHDFLPEYARAEQGTLWVMVLTALTMVVEIAAGSMLGSMALLADGWHMATHVAAFAIALFAYRYARSRSADPRFTFGTGKVTVLAGFTSAVALAVVALVMAIESVARLFAPRPIQFDDAIWIAAVGLAVNLLSGVILHRAGEHGHSHTAASAHDHDHDHDHHDEHASGRGRDHNLRAAYLHVVADALTSVLAIVALGAGKYFGLGWLDAAMGLVGAALITRWAWSLAQDSAAVLLDRTPDTTVIDAIRAAIEAEAHDSVADLHVWQVGPAQLAASISIVSHAPRTPEFYRRCVARIAGLAHVTVEVNACVDPACADAPPRGTP